MKAATRRGISRILALSLTVGTVFSNFTGFEVFAAGKTIDVWDFGGVQQSGTLYTNHIDRTFLDGVTAVGDASSNNKGKFLDAGDVDFNGVTVNAVKNDRLFYNGADGSRSYGTNGKAESAYTDGYTANGMWYANGTGGDNRRYLLLKDVNAGDGVTVYAGPSNTSDVTVHFSNAAGEDDTHTVLSGEMDRIDFVANNSGEYKIWFGAEGGKPVVNRVVKYPAVKVTGKIDFQGIDTTGNNYNVTFKNKQTGDVFEAVFDAAKADNSFTVDLTPGYDYTATLSGMVGYGFTNKSKTVNVSLEDISADKAVELVVETKSTYKVSGKITGFAGSYDMSGFVLQLVPDAESMADVVTATVGEDYSYEAVLEPDIDYEVNLVGVNDYEVKEGGKVNSNKDLTQDVVVEAKPVYSVSGNFVGENTKVNALTFTNVDDDYTYSAEKENISEYGYSVMLRDGSYLVSAEAEGASTRTHVVVKGEDVLQDLFFVSTAETAPVDYSADVYVGMSGNGPSFDTVSDAMDCVDAMTRTEGQRVTVHIAPGTYREQISVSAPDVSFVKEGEGDVVLTWYYGIGYKYYSAQSNGWYDEQDAFEKYGKKTVEKWGTGTYVKESAKNFRAEGITFEASFNKYVTDEEIKDGVESDGSIAFKRKLGADVTSKSATERSTAISIEGDNVEFKDCTFVGSQDTLYIGGKSTNDVYFKDCVIEGNTDYIFGSGDAVFDGCELRYCGYSDQGAGGYVTAGRSNNYDGYTGYLFRSCTITNKDNMKHAAGYFGRPWDQNANIFFYNTKLENADAITAEGWTEMSGTKPEQASFKEYNTTYAGQAVDTASRIANTVQASASVDPKTYFGADWTPVFYVEEKGTPAFVREPNLSTDGDVLLPATGNTFKVVYDLGENADTDASRIDWYTVDADGTETLVKTVSAIENEGLLVTNSMLDKKLKAVVTPILYSGAEGQSATLVTEKEVTKGSGYREANRPGGKSVIFLAGDSTVKDYSAGAINNSGANRSEGSWGEFFGDFIDSTNYEVMDYAEGGRSSRTFIDGTKDDGSDRFFDKIKEQMVEGDYLFIQFGHNDSSADYADRYVKTGEKDAEGKYPYTAPSADKAGDGTFAWYLQQYVDAAKAAGATPVMVTPVSRLYFGSDGKIYSHHGSNDEYVTITKQVAEDNNILCIDLYTMSKELYEKAYADLGDSSEAARLFAYGEKTHHSKMGGFVLAAMMADYVQDDTDLEFADDIVIPESLSSSDAKDNTEFNLWKDGSFVAYGKNEAGVYDESIIDTYWSVYAAELLENLEEAPEAALYGDANDDGLVKADDSAFVLQYTLNPAVVDINIKNSDVDGKEGISSSDSANILQKALVSTFKFPVEEAA